MSDRKHMCKKIRLKVLALLCAASLLSGCTIGEKEYVLDLNYVGRNDVISINGEECSMEETKLYLCNYQNIYGKEYGVNLWEYEFSTEDISVTLEEYVKDITLLQLSNVLCMNQLAKQMDVKLTNEEMKLVEDASQKYYASLNEAEKKYMGIDQKEMQSFYKKYATAKKLYEQLTQGVDEEVSVDEARVLRIQQIFVASLDTAKEVQNKLKNEDFSKVAAKYNESEQVEITVVRGELPKIVEKAVYALNDGEKTGMIKTETGYYFVKCLSKNEAELTEKNKTTIIERRRKEQFEDEFHAFVERSTFEINQKAWDSIAIDTSGSIVTDSFFEIYDGYFKN